MSKRHRENRQRTETLATLLMPVFEERLEENLGNRLRELRRQQGLSLRSLAEKSGLSANTLSLIENGKTSPSVATLQQVALALNVPITSFFEMDVKSEPVIFTKSDARPGSPFAYGTLEEMGSGLGNDGFQPFITNLNAHASSGPQPLTHDGSEFIFCLSGRIIYNVAGNEYTLEPGDSLMFASHMPHSWFNPQEEPVRMLMVLSTIEDHKTNHRVRLIQAHYPG
jgi:transcriptional regulator with XRE-family HTH domain